MEREEELLTNTLQKKLDTLRKEKEQLEVRLCMEQRRSPTSQVSHYTTHIHPDTRSRPQIHIVVTKHMVCCWVLERLPAVRHRGVFLDVTCWSVVQMYGQQPVMGEARENLDTILRDSEGQVLVQVRPHTKT